MSFLMPFDEIINSLKKTPKTWVITGVAGFIGSNLLESLLSMNQHVIGIDNFLTGHQKNIEDVKKLVNLDQWFRFKFVEGDICNLQDCNKLFDLNKKNKVDYVLHNAALGSVPRSIGDPITTNHNNVDGFLNMLVAARDAKVEKFIYAASSSTYGDDVNLPKIESRIGKPLSPYAVTKYVNELYANVFYKTYGLQTLGLRYFNVFGPRQDPKGSYAAVIPKWINDLMASNQIFINGDGETSRDFCYVQNIVQANILAAVQPFDGDIDGVFNVAVGNKTSLNELFLKIKKELLRSCPWVVKAEPTHVNFRRGDVMHSLADISKAYKYLGYKPTHNIDDGLKIAIDWYVNNKNTYR